MSFLFTPPFAGNLGIARRFLYGCASAPMRALIVGDSEMVNLGCSLQRSLRPAKWSGFLGGLIASTPDVNYGFGISYYISPSCGAWTQNADMTGTWTFSGGPAYDAGTTGVGGCMISWGTFAYTGNGAAADFQQVLRAGDFLRAAQNAGHTPIVESIVKKTATGQDGVWYLCAEYNNSENDRYPASGGVIASGSGFVKYTMPLPTALPASATFPFRWGWRLPNNFSGIAGKTLDILGQYRVHDGSGVGFELGDIAVGGSQTVTWATADGVYPDAVLSALVNLYGVTDLWIMLGQNGVATQSQIQAVMSRFRAFNPSANIAVTLVSPYETSNGVYQDSSSQLAQVNSMMSAIAQADGNCLHLNLYDALGPHELNYANAGTGLALYDNYLQQDGVHPGPVGKGRFAEALQGRMERAADAAGPLLLQVARQVGVLTS